MALVLQPERDGTHLVDVQGVPNKMAGSWDENMLI